MASAHIDVLVEYVVSVTNNGAEKMWCLKVQMLLSGMPSKKVMLLPGMPSKNVR